MQKESMSRIRQKTKKVKQSGGRVLFRLIFGRTMITVLLLLLQILCLIGIFRMVGLSENLLTISNLLGMAAIIYIINSEENPAFKLAWVLPICLVPVFGIGFYLFIILNPGNRGLQKLLNRRKDETKPYLRTEYRVVEKLKKESSGIRNLGHYIQNQNGFPTCDHTNVTFFATGEEKYADLLKELERAEQFIFLEYFIINQGEVWDHVLEILERKAKAGVEVRVMYDGMCALVSLPYRYPQQLRERGIKAKMFSPIKPLLSTHQNNRDHRKICVIDGHTAFTGGVNLADEYINQRVRFGHWKDTAVMLKGKAVDSFTMMFLQLWDVTERDAEEYRRFLCPETFHMPEGMDYGGFVMPYADSPLDGENVGESVYLDILGRSRRYVHITTPYLILDDTTLAALKFAAKRGVEVIIIMPHIPDKLYAYLLARSYYAELLRAGVQIYEYTPGFIHAKMFTSDDEKAVVGTINLDFRSLYLHFECASYFFRNAVVMDVEEDFQKTLAKSERITLENCRKYPFIRRFAGKALRILAPLM